MRIGLTVGVVAGLLAVGAMAAEAPPRPADTDTRPCENYPDMDLTAYVAAYSAAPKYTTPKPADQFVPKDVVIENGPVAFTTIRTPGDPIRGSVPAYDLPIREGDYTADSDRWVNNDFFPNGAIATSPCRVRDPSGKRWLVLRDSLLGSLEYYNFDRFKPVTK